MLVINVPQKLKRMTGLFLIVIAVMLIQSVSEDKMKVGDIQTDIDDSEWVIVAITGRGIVSRVRRNSLAHYTHAEGNDAIYQSLGKDVDGSTTETTPANRPDKAT